jgi:hypothetical protein
VQTALEAKPARSHLSASVANAMRKRASRLPPGVVPRGHSVIALGRKKRSITKITSRNNPKECPEDEYGHQGLGLPDEKRVASCRNHQLVALTTSNAARHINKRPRRRVCSDILKLQLDRSIHNSSWHRRNPFGAPSLMGCWRYHGKQPNPSMEPFRYP